LQTIAPAPAAGIGRGCSLGIQGRIGCLVRPVIWSQ